MNIYRNTMNLKQLIACLFMLLAASSMQAQVIPSQMEFCGIQLTFTADAKRKLAEYVGRIYESPRYFNQMVNRADTYMPFIEEAFTEVGVPHDLKYLAIQESGLRPDAISTSRAVGFWQLKRDAALEVGLQVDEQVDERMHIYKASLAAARYLSKANKDFDNWVYALIAYYEGLTGAVPHTEPKYYGEKRMTISAELHWYALKAIAHKIAYEEAIAMGSVPQLWLQPYSTAGETHVRKLCLAHKISEEDFLAVNKWIVDPKRLPKGRNYTYYIPRTRETYAGHIPDPVKMEQQLAANQPPTNSQPLPLQEEPPASPPPVAHQAATSLPATPSTPSPGPAYQQAAPVSQLPQQAYAMFDLQQDIHYGIDYLLYDGSLLVPQIANRYGIRLSKLLMWNGLSPHEEPAKGSILYLVKPKKARFHVVMPQENLAMIAFMHGRTPAQLQQKNRMKHTDFAIYAGQKLYLKKTRPRNEKLIIFDLFAPESPATAQADEKPHANELSGEPLEADNQPTAASPGEEESAGPEVPEVRSRWVTHIVQSGESLWQISQLYNTKVDIIKRINELSSDAIYEGQVLRILAREE
ncbi:MAG: LysM peptidoglycan-binding domain-containing protein [Bacteroidetes bacterium]|nr:MAG: LysM peptidoglycan-binding domain-containing protein [Bacteroidota bacterium]